MSERRADAPAQAQEQPHRAMTADVLRVLLLGVTPGETGLTRQSLAGDSGLQVEAVHSLAEAQARLAQGDVDVLLTELSLPDGSVRGLILSLRQRMAPTAIVIHSNAGGEREVLTLMRLGADDWVRKTDGGGPPLPEVLREAHARRMRGRRRHDRLLNVLYVENSAMEADLTLRHLADAAPHLRLHHVGTAAQALERLPQQAGQPCEYDVVLTDYQLPGDNGLELLHTLRQQRRLNVPVVLMTGHGSHTVAKLALRDGAADYVAKDDHHLALLPLVLENAFHRAASAREHARLQASEERLALIVQGSNDGAWDVDLRRGRSYASARWWAMIGQPPRVLEHAMQMYDAVVPAERDQMIARMDAALANPAQTRFELECHLLHADGTQVPVVSRGVIQRDADGHAVRLAGLNTDMTAWRRIEHEMRELATTLEQRVLTRTEELAQANRELEAYAESISADVRAPLHAIDALAQLLGREHGAALGEDGLRLLGLLRGSVYRAEGLISDLLVFARSAHEPLARGHVPMGAVVRHCLSEQAQAMAHQGLHVQIDPMPDAQGDVGLLRQVMAQLIGNAIKFSAGRPGARLTIGHDGVAWFVRDEGVGFDMQAAEGRLFKLFARLHAGNYPGNGVGLAIATRLVERHGGRLWAQSTPGQGSTFFFSLGHNSGAPP